MNAPQPASHAAPRRFAGQVRRPALILAAVFFLAVGIAWAAYWVLVGRYYEDTDDAYVGGHVVQVTPQVAGTVTAVGVDDTDMVEAGQTVVKLDPADSHYALQQAEAALAQAVRQTVTLYDNNDVLQANIALRETELARAEDDLARRRSVAGTGAVSAEDLRHAELSVATARAAIETARQQLHANQALTANTRVETHPNVAAAAGHLREVYLAARRGEVLAPVAGEVARRAVQVGQRVAPGTPLMALIPLADLWVDANFKEVQLAGMRIGQPVKLVADVYGGKFTFHGKVAGLGAGTGAAFALLPAQNATGNWIKVVQRVPVRIALEREELKQHPLRVGLSMRATVDLHDTSGSPVAGPAAPGLQPAASDRTEVYDSLASEADALIDRIVAANGGHPLPHPHPRAAPTAQGRALPLAAHARGAAAGA